jgi:aminoglycoside 6'-N-acetyltransferase
MLEGENVILRPLVESDVRRLREIVETREVARWWGPQDADFPLTDEPEVTRFVILDDDRVVGMIQYGEEDEAAFRHAWIDVFVDPAHHGRGIGTDAFRTLLDKLVGKLGHHRVAIDPSVDNLAFGLARSRGPLA